MSDNDTTAYDSTVSGNNNSDTGMVHVPAQVQRDLGICLDTDVEVTLEDLDHEFIDSITFENPQTAGDGVSVPARIMRQVDLEPGQEVSASFALPESDDDQEESLADSPGSESDEGESDDWDPDDVFGEDEEEDVADEEEDEPEGLGKLFG